MTIAAPGKGFFTIRSPTHLDSSVPAGGSDSMSRLVPKESAIVIGVMFGITVLAGVLRFTHEDITALFNRPSQEQIAAGEQAIDQLESTAEALDTSNLIADIAPCSRWRGFAEACVTVTDGFQRAPDRIDVAKRIWRTWA